MRIIAGEHRGRQLVAPGGHLTRPTADKTRQALFNVLEHVDWAPDLKGARVIDLFAGSGALGLEALSRGASSALLIDNDSEAIVAITRNLTTLRLDGTGKILKADVRRLGASREPPFDLAFLDPPYAKDLCEPALAALADGGWLSPGALAVVERGASEPAPVAPGYEQIDSRIWGAAKVWFLVRSADARSTVI
jgi:16S rRNA (guanine966-N2)-methyltransferase